MSTLKVGNIQDTNGSNQSSPSQIFEGRARAWVNYDQRVLQDTRNDYGVTSVTDLDEGEGRVNFSNTLSNPCAVGACSYNPNIADAQHSDTMAIYTTNTYAEYSTRNTSHEDYDDEYVFMAVFSDSNN